MAGAGKKTFVAGEVLTAAQVNDYLMDQAVMRFSGSAARAASITAPTEGMVTYLDDANAIEMYNGAAWVRLETASAYAANYTAKGQILVATGSGSFVAQSVGTDGQYLTASSGTTDGLVWTTPAGAGDAAYLQISASGVTALPTTLDGGFYRIALSTTASYTDVQWRFVDSNGFLYGATITSGLGFITIPTTVASLNITTGTFPFNVLIEEIVGVSNTLPSAPTVTAFNWTAVTSASFTATTSPTAASIGVFNTATGKFNNLGPASVRTGASIGLSSAPYNTGGASYDVAIVQSSPTGVWSKSAPISSPAYPFYVYTANGTYVPPPGSASADILVVSGGGGGGGAAAAPTSGGGGGAGGASLFTNVATPASVAVTVGAGGASNTNGNASSFGPRSTTGGGRGGANPVAAGQPGGSGGGGGTPLGAAGTGTTGQGNPGGAMGGSPSGLGAGGGGGVGTAGTAGNPSTNAGGAGGSGSFFYGILLGGGGGGSGGPGGDGAGGPGGGGNGARYNTIPGTANTGGGGGGSSTGPTGGGVGGSGIVIVRAR